MQGPRSALNGRYQFSLAFRYQEDTARWLAIDERTGQEVVVQLVEAARVARFEAGKGFVHPHLAGIVDVARRLSPEVVPGGQVQPGTALVVAEYLPGVTLFDLLRDKGPVHPARAVAWWLRLADALVGYHAAGGLVGNISPRTLLAKPRGRAVPPVLAQLTAPLLGATFSPERLRGSGPAPQDDVWALYVTLYWALTGQAPFQGKSRDALVASVGRGQLKPLRDYGIDDPTLQEILARGLRADSALRSAELGGFVVALNAWEAGQSLPTVRRRSMAPRLSGIVSGGLTPPAASARAVFDADSLADDLGPDRPAVPLQRSSGRVADVPSAGPAPIPHSQTSLSELGAQTARPAPVQSHMPDASQLSKRPSVNPFGKKPTAWPLLLGLVAVIGGLGAVIFMDGGKQAPVPSAESAAPLPEPAVRKKPVRRALSPAEALNACVSSYFPDQVFSDGSDFAFACAPGDLREITEKLYEMSEQKADELAEALADAGAGTSSSAGVKPKGPKESSAEVRIRRPLGWYEILATAVIRKGCCPSAAPVVLPETTGWCEQLQDVVRDLAEDSARSGDLAPRLKRFDKAVECLFANKVQRPYSYKKSPLTEDNKKSLQEFLSRAAMSDAKRRTLGR